MKTNFLRIGYFTTIGCLIYSAATAIVVNPGDILISNPSAFGETRDVRGTIFKIDQVTDDLLGVSTGEILANVEGLAYNKQGGIIFAVVSGILPPSGSRVIKAEPNTGNQTPILEGNFIRQRLTAIAVGPDGIGENPG